MKWLPLYSTAYAQVGKIDTSFMEIPQSSSGNGAVMFVIVGIIVSLVVFGYAYKWYKGKKIAVSGRNYLEKKAMGQQKTQLDIPEGASKQIIILANTANTTPEALITDNRFFEKAVDKVLRIAPNDSILNKVPGLREDLGYVFFNRRAPFISSKMLQPGQKMRVGINYKGKSHYFVSTLLNSTEKEFWVKPPTVKGKTINMSKFKSLEFRVFRKSDGEFRFVCKLRSQIDTPAHAIVLGHTNAIKRLPKREDARYELKFKRTIYFITTVNGLKRASVESAVSAVGIVEDISIGGMKFRVKKQPANASIGTTIMFRLGEANIRQEIHGNIIRINQVSADQINFHVQFYDMSELNRLYLQKFISRKNAKQIK